MDSRRLMSVLFSLFAMGGLAAAANLTPLINLLTDFEGVVDPLVSLIIAFIPLLVIVGVVNLILGLLGAIVYMFYKLMR